MVDLFLRLKNLRQFLTDLLDAFQLSSRTGKAVPVEEALRRVEAGFRDLSDLGAIASADSPAERARLEREMTALRRLTAMVHDCAAREQQGVRHLLDRIHEARAELTRQRQALEVGPSIDLAG
jgi:hypothetical protein